MGTKPGDDGLVRKVTIRLASDLDKHGIPVKNPTILERPVHKMVVLLEASWLFLGSLVGCGLCFIKI